MPKSNQPASQKIKLTACYYMALFALGLTTGAMGPAIPHLAEQTGTHLKDISFILIMLSLGYLLGSLAGGRLIDRIKGHPVIITGLIGMAISFTLIPMSPELILLAVLAFILGLTQSFIDVGANLMIVWAHGQNVGSYMNGLHLSFGVGTLVAPLVLAASLERTGAIRWGFITLALLSLPAAAWLTKLPSPLVDHPKQENSGLNRRWLPLLILIMLFYLMYVGYEAAFGAWIYTYALKLGLGTEITAAYLTSAFWAAFTFGRFLGIPVARRFSPAVMLSTGVITGATSLTIMWAFPSSATVLWVTTLFFGLGVSTLFPTLFTLASQSMPLSGKLTSLFFASASVGGMLFPWLVGQLIDARGALVMTPSLLCLVVISAFIIAGIIGLNRRRAVEAPQ
jgi:FHS family Na+ dependent glucose MFS transporter 1